VSVEKVSDLMLVTFALEKRQRAKVFAFMPENIERYETA
jgi:hypothetical protein